MARIPTTLEQLLTQCRQSRLDLDRQLGRIEEFIGAMPPLRFRAAPPRPQLKPAPVPEPLPYLTDRDLEAVVAVEQMLALARLMRGRSEHAYYRDAGIHLARLRQVEGRSQAEFGTIVEQRCGLSLSRAQELMQLAHVPGAEAKAALFEIRRGKADRVRKSRQNKEKGQDATADPARRTRPKG